jgi:hypothetical protein
MPVRIEGILPNPNKNCPSEFKLRDFMRKAPRPAKRKMVGFTASCFRGLRAFQGSW